MTEEEIRTLVEALGGMLAVLKEANPVGKAEVYRQLGLKITYEHEERVALAEVQPRPPVGVVVVSGEGFDHYAHALTRRTRLAVRLGS